MAALKRSLFIGMTVVASMGVAGAATASGVTARRAALPVPGTPSQVAALVAAATKIEKLPSPLVPSLQNAGYDNAANYYPVIKQQCVGTTQCVFGDKSSSTTVVLFGDSHAAMWLPALVYDGTHLHFRVVLLWYSGCPAADLTVWNPSQHGIDKGCDGWRSKSVAQIKALAPSLVLLTDRTTAVNGATNKPIPNATWKAGMATTISSFLSAKLKVGLIGDITALSKAEPYCLASNPSKVQSCSAANPNPAFATHVADEKAAAKAQKVPYVNPQRWFCTRWCSPIVGNMVAYYDTLHASATYAEYLSLVLEQAIKPLLPPG